MAASSDSGIDVRTTSISDDKEVAVPTSNTDKQVTIPHTDTDKQVFSRTSDSSKEVRPTHFDGTSDTAKQAVPTLPPISMEKEVSAPTNDGDKQLTSTLSRKGSIGLSRTNAFLAYRVEKENALGLIMPQDQKLAVHELDVRTGQGVRPAYVTGSMSWIDVVSVLPPMFELFRCTSGEGGRGMSMEMTARSLPKGWQGLIGLKVDIEAHCQSKDGGVRREKWEVDRRGSGRTYKLTREGEKNAACVWKGTSSSVKEMISGGEKKERVHKGNLKLVSGQEDGKVMAVWQQARDSDVLGDLIIFNEARGSIAPEVIITTCLTAVSAERATGMNWFGGLGK